MEKYKLSNYLFKMKTATSPALFDVAEDVDKLPFGCINIALSEFLDLLEKKSEFDEEFLNSVIEASDTGELMPRLTKENNNRNSVKVPINFHAHTSSSNVKNEVLQEEIIKKLNRAFARRAFVCYPDNKEYRTKKELIKLSEDELNRNFEDYEKTQVDFRELINEYNSYFGNLYRILRTNPEPFRLSKEARRQLYIYDRCCSERANSIKDFEEEGLISEMLSRKRKVLNLAVINAALNGIIGFEIKEKDVIEAIYEVEFFGKYLKKLYNIEIITDIEKFFCIFQESSAPLSRTELKKKSIIPQNTFSETSK